MAWIDQSHRRAACRFYRLYRPHRYNEHSLRPDGCSAGARREPHFDRPVYLHPNQERVEWDKGGWEISPLPPRWTENIVFIGDLPAISYSETILGWIKGNRLGTIVGKPSAGANGDISVAYLPGNYGFIWTGMRMVNRDGSQHHLRGVVPDVVVSPTMAGVRAGRDKMLEKALEIVRSREKPN